MPIVRGAAAVILAGVTFVAWGARAAVSTSGRTDAVSMTVTPVVTAGTPPPFVTRNAEGTRLWDLTRQFYQKRSDAPAWIGGGTPRPQVDELTQALRHADRDGIDPSIYDASSLDPRTTDPADLDVRLTYLYLQYVSNLTSGIADVSHSDPNWQMRPAKSDPLARLEQALDQNRIGASLEELTPHHPQYMALRDTLAQYRDIAQRGGWPMVPAQLELKPGQADPAVPVIARRLAVTGDYSGAINAQDAIYGPELQEAVKRFQRRHGLEPDGVVGARAVAAMNVPVETRIEQLTLNLERWRWLPRDLGDRHILVNIPEYRLEVWDHDTVPLSMRVVVGKKATPTPVFSEEMTHLVFAPYWNVPPDIVKNEMVPHALRDPAFLERTSMDVLDRNGNTVDPASIDMANMAAYRFRQRPGSSNSLGLVKFMFPNPFNVYLHDTPADSLFARATRSFSHGCVRLEQPDKLAAYVLGDQPAWTQDRIDEAMHGGQEKTVKLSRPLPVYLGYWTARVSADGVLQFRDDLYGIDARQSATIASALEKLKAGAAAEARTAEPRPRS